MALIVGAELEVIETNGPSKSITGGFPYLETENGSIIGETEAIVKYIARMNLATGLLGKHQHDHAKINEWIAWCQTSFITPAMNAQCMIYGHHMTNMDSFNSSVKKMKEQARILDKWLQEHKWVTGDNFSLADIFIGSVMIPVFQLIFDAGFRKAVPNLTKWFDRFCLDPFVQGVYGLVQPCIKAIKPYGAPADKVSKKP